MNVAVEKSGRNPMDQKASSSVLGIKDDSFTKSEDEYSLSDGGETFLGRSLKSTHFSFENVRFTPKIIEFTDAFEGKQFAVKITIQNVGRNPVWVKVGEPNSFIFQLKKPSRRTKFLAAGASITKTLTYTYHNVDLIQKSQIPVQINGHFVDYPIVVKKAVPDIEIYPQKLDFKIINIGASAKTMVLTIYNKGGKRTKFKVDVGKNILDFVVSPMRGTIKAKSQVNVLVEMMGLNEGEYYHELWIKTNELPIRVPVLVKVVKPRLEVVYPNGTEDFTLITFKPTFNGTQKAQSFVLKNCSTDTTLFNTLAEVNGELQILENARKSTDAFNMFMLTAEEGRLEPFEKRIFTVLFRPRAVDTTKKSWHHKQDEKKKTQWEYIVFLRISRVHRIERRELEKVQLSAIQNKAKGKSNRPKVSYSKLNQAFDFPLELEEESTDRRSNFFADSSAPEEKVLRLCLHGNAVEPDIIIQPLSFEFGDIDLGRTENKILRISNNAGIPIKCRLCKTVNVKTTPHEIWLSGEKAHEFVVSLTPKCAGRFKKKMKVQILAKSDVVFDTDKNLSTVAMYTVTLNYNAKDIFTISGPKIGSGITPLITDEVGLQKDLITFKDANKCPFAAMLALKKGFKTPWMINEKDKLRNVENAIIAFPNDRPRLFYAWPKNKICRTIFSGFFRYSPPEDLTYTLSSKERSQTQEQYKIWSDYIKFLKEMRRLNYPNPEELNRCLEYDVSCEKHYKMEHIKLNSKLELTVPNSKSLEACPRGPEEPPEYTFVPLSPMLLSNVTVEPKFINFNKVAVSTVAQKEISINNMNAFPISIKFVSGKSAVSIMEQDTITIEPSATKLIQIVFQSKDLGRYFGFLNYLINGSHEFKITISAFVMSKTVSLGDSPVNLQFGMYDSKEAFQPRSLFLPIENPLQSTIRYRWSTSRDSAFHINISEGEIPPRSTLLAEVLFDVCPKKSFYSEMFLISEGGNSETVKLVHPSKKVAVSFLSSRVDMHDIPLNLPTKVKAVVQNACYHDVAFEVLDANPVPGIIIEPRQGLIKARSFFFLEIIVQIPVIMKFCFNVILMVHFVHKISVKVTGNVVAPVIRMKPSEIAMRKICAQSVDTFSICVENMGTTPAEVRVNFKNCPEYRVADGDAKLYLLPKQASKFMIQFEPTDVARYMFYLPVTINKILGPPEMQEPETEYVHFYVGQYESLYEQHGEVFNTSKCGLKIPCVCLNSTVTQSILSISLLNVNFKLESKLDKEFQAQDIVFSNEFNDDVTFCIRNDDLGEHCDSPFNLIPVETELVESRLKSMKAHLRKGEKLVMKATFEPKNPGSYSVKVPIFVRGYSNGLVYNFVSLNGELKSPFINPEAEEIHFPPLPLNVGCDIIVMINAENYRTPDTISCIVYNPKEEKGEIINEYIKTKWLTEPNISQCQKSSIFQLQINFQSSVPIALKNYILLCDSKGTYSSIFVTAVADNSVLTTHGFLSIRSTKYKLMRDKPPQRWKAEEILDFPFKKSDLKIEKGFSDRKTKSKVNVENSEPNIMYSASSLQVDKGPRLIIQEAKSVSKATQLGFADYKTNSSTFLYVTKSKFMSSCRYILVISKSESIFGSRTFSNAPMMKRTNLISEVSYPNFPVEEGLYKKHFEGTLRYMERWIFEVIMRCDQYFSIPWSFQRLIERVKPHRSNKNKTIDTRPEKDFLDFMHEIVGQDSALPKCLYLQLQIYCSRVASSENNRPENRAARMRSTFADILQYLESNGCLLPHVRPEYLMEYDNYILYRNEFKNVETIPWKSIELDRMNSMRILQDATVKNKSEREGPVQKSSSIFSPRDSWKKSLFEGYMEESETEVAKTEEKVPDPPEIMLFKQKLDPLRDLVEGRRFEHKVEILDKITFDLRSTQAWLDIIIQIFRVFILRNVVLRNTIPQVSMIGINDKISVQTVELKQALNESKGNSQIQIVPNEDSLSSNVYTVQERILLDWLNGHCQIQEELLWSSKSKSESPTCQKVINNFDKDLSDSVALISVTASHCPYIVTEYFSDVYFKPDIPNKAYHNAGRLIQAWRVLEIGLSVETTDIVQPNPVFMVILVSRLYDVLPTLHPHSLICFSTPLNTDITRVIQLKNDSQERIFYKVKFFGEHEGFFDLGGSPLIELKPFKTTDVNLMFTARKIKKISATLLFTGCCVSPNFAKHLTFYLEGKPSELPESDKFSFFAPLYRVVCTEIPVRPPFSEPATYEIWYTTKQPVYSESVDISTVTKQWSQIWNRKISRRLFLNKSEVKIDDEQQKTTLGVTVACLTDQIRFFWLLFRSKIGDFIILIEIKPKFIETNTIVTGFYSDSWSPSATCLCSDGKLLPKPHSISSGGCPFLTEVKIPTRNEQLWSALWTMFLKTLQPREKSFWKEHFEMDIGICLILWLLSSDEEESVIDEFIQVLPTKVAYSLKVEPPNDVHVVIPPSVEILGVLLVPTSKGKIIPGGNRGKRIRCFYFWLSSDQNPMTCMNLGVQFIISDVRKKSEIALPIHISKSAPSTLFLKLIMTSENTKEIRSLNLQLSPRQDSEEPRSS